MQFGEKVSHFRTEIGHPLSPMLGYFPMGILAHSDKYKNRAAAEKEKNSPTETWENLQSQKLKTGMH